MVWRKYFAQFCTIISQSYSPVLYTIGLLARNYPNHKSYVIISFTISPLIELYTTSYKTHTPNILFHYEKYTLLSTQSFSWYYWKEMVIKESSVIQFVWRSKDERRVDGCIEVSWMMDLLNTYFFSLNILWSRITRILGYNLLIHLISPVLWNAKDNSNTALWQDCNTV